MMPGFRLFSLSAAIGALLIAAGTTAFAVEYDPALPRVEEVRDVDGSVWKVLIVPRPLYQPGVAVSSKLPVVIRPRTASWQPPAVKQAQVPPAPKKSVLLPEQTELVSTQADETQKEKVPATSDNPFGVKIVPRFPVPTLPPSPAPPLSEGEETHVNPFDYSWIYQTIPFLRSEYVANPSYRHDATMDILFGKLRPQAVEEQAPQPRPHGTMFPNENNTIRPNSYYSLGPATAPSCSIWPYRGLGAYGQGAYPVNYYTIPFPLSPPNWGY
jgi:hypothetical protein